MIDLFASLWKQIIDATAIFVIPDWGALIGLIPILVLIGLVGPIVTLVTLGWIVFALRKPGAAVTLEEGPTLLPIEEDGSVSFPIGLPYCPPDRLVYASGAHRCRECGGDLAVICPMCGLGRSAAIITCGNCGLVLKVEQRARILRPAGPPRGGGALA